MDIPWSQIASLTTAGLSGVAAVGAWMASRRSSSTAEMVARIERERWHADLTPRFNITVERDGEDRATLDVQLVGPIPLRHLDEVRIRIGNSDDLERPVAPPGRPTQPDVDAHVWGPYRFTPGVDGADANGRSVAPVPMQVGRGRPFSLQRTYPAPWQEGPDLNRRWRDQWLNKPLRLAVTCSQEGFEPWVVPCDVEISQAARYRPL